MIPNEIPNDVNGDVLRRMLSGGDKLTEPRNINFHFLFSSRNQAIRFIEAITDKSLELMLRWYEPKDLWESTVTKYMVPTHTEITAVENSLIGLAHSLNGEPDGWGCFSVK